MDLKTLIETVAPTKIGWVLDTNADSELKASLEFRGQLMALCRGCGTRETIASEAFAVDMAPQA